MNWGVNMHKRIAIQLFGHLRTFRETSEYFFKNILQPIKNIDCEVDIFLHTWDELDAVQVRDFYTKDMKYAGLKLTEEEKQEALKIYNPKRFLFEQQSVLTENEIKNVSEITKEQATIWKNLSHTICTSSQLRQEYEKENNIQYDLIIATRPDIEFLRPISLKPFYNNEGGWKWFDTMQDKFFTTYISGVNFVTSQEYYIAGSDLLIIASPQAFNKIFDFNKYKNHFFKMKPECAIAQIAKIEGLKHDIISFEKDKYWRIKRFNEKYNKINKLADEFYNFILPFLVESPRFCSDIQYCTTDYNYTKEEGIQWFLSPPKSKLSKVIKIIKKEK